jgi:hypothetical protein
MVADDPQGLLLLAQQFGSADAHRLVPYFEGYISTLRSTSGVTFDWQPLVELIERIVPNLTTADSGVAQVVSNLISQGVGASANPIPDELHERCIAAMATVVETFATPLSTDPEGEGRIGLHHQINHAAGCASDAFMRCLWALWVLRRDDGRSLPPVVREPVEASLANDWGGIEFRHALGEFWFVLEWWEPGWLAAHIDHVWPDGDAHRAINARRTFFFGFLFSETVPLPALASLAEMFGDAVLDFGNEHKSYFDETRLVEPFVHLLTIAWLHDLPGYGFDGVMGAFLDSAPDDVRSAFVRRLGYVSMTKPDNGGIDDRRTWIRRNAYWARRADDLGKGLNITQPSKELSAFCTWLKHSTDTMSALEPRLNISIDHLAEGGYRRDLIAFIAARGVAEPLPSIRVMLRLVERLLEEGTLGIWTTSPEMEAALSAISQGAKPSHRRLIRKIANCFVRAGVTNYQGILNGGSK